MGLLRRFFISNLFILVSVVVVMAVVGFYILQMTIRDYASSRIHYVSVAKSAELEKYFAQKKLLVDILSDSEKLKSYLRNQQSEGVEAHVDSFLNKTDLFDLILIKQTGEVLYSHQGAFRKGENIQDFGKNKITELFTWSEDQKDNKALLLDFSRVAKYENKEVMIFSKVIVEMKNALGLIILVYSKDQFQKYVQRELSRNIQVLGPSSVISVYGEDSLLRISSFDQGSWREQIDGSRMKDAEMQSSTTQTLEAVNYGSYLSAASISKLPDNLNWFVEVSVNEKDIFRGMYPLFAGFVLVMFTIVSIVSLLSYYGNMKLIKPLYDVIDNIKRLGTSEKPEKISNSDFHELGYLVQNYNDLVDRLEWTQLSRNYFEGILESIHEFVFICEREQTDSGEVKFFVKQVNKSICESFKIGRYDLIGSDLQNYLKLDSTQFDQVIQAESDAFVEGYLVIMGTTLPVIVKPSQIRSVGEKNFVVLCNDISQQRMQQQALVKAKEEAVHASKAKSEFLAKMSHEIRTPLNVIVGVADLLKSGKEQDLPESERKNLLHILSTAGENLLALINDILDISKIEAQEIKVESIPTKIGQVVEEVVNVLSSKASSKGIELHFTNLISTETSSGYSLIDPTRLRQVIFNLIGNSVKFTDKGSVEVILGYFDTTQKELLIEVRDSGVGISKENQGQLFKSFTQADSSISRKFGGTGLGLAISKNLVELMGGKIWFQSELGSGTSFYFTLPYLPVHFQETEDLSKGQSPASNVISLGKHRRFRVLVTDDSEDNRLLIKAYLKNEPVDIIEAENGQEAVDLVRTGHRFDLIFIDIQMPVLDGYAATALIRDFEVKNSLSRTPILALSANAMVEDFEKSKQMDCDAHLTKPIRKTEILNAIGKFAA